MKIDKIAELEKENAELKAQIENMKCCENCKKHRNAKCPEDEKFYARVTNHCEKWVLANNEPLEKLELFKKAASDLAGMILKIFN